MRVLGKFPIGKILFSNIPATIVFFNDVLDAYFAFYVGLPAFVEGFNIGKVFFLSFKLKKLKKKKKHKNCHNILILKHG